MRLSKGTPRMRRMIVVALLAVMVAVFVMPAVASALTPSTLRAPLYLSVSKTVKISGHISPAVKYKNMTIEIRKPGRTWWTVVGTPKINKYGNWSLYYKPKVKGSFYIRARYRTTSTLSRTAKLLVRKGPGVTYELVLASTTSTRDSGLFEALRPLFLKECPEYKLKATFVGSGAAMGYGARGDADVLLTHSPADEVKFMLGTFSPTQTFKGLTRYKVMYNDFVLVGPTANPAGIAVGDPALTAFQKLATTGSKFISRNDNSGTNAKEKTLWAALTPANPQTGQSWYQASGTMGMAQALAAASQQNAYTLADRATWLTAYNLGMTTGLKIINEGDTNYFNQYAVIEVAKAVNWEGAQDFRRFIMASSTQKVIAAFGLDTYGKALFVPNAGSYPWQ